ncbi:MAG TPA: class D sortase [Gemmatimonadaceae bacterium]|nr:class D sortase [Gemmatimonadaceae bacterium]
MTRRRAGALLFGVGVALVLYTGTTWASGALARDRARSEWEATLARARVQAIRATLGVRNTPTARGAPVARLVIPRIGLDEIVVEGVGDRELNAGPGHLPGSVLPGQSGNAILSAHRDRHFSALDRLTIGDTVYTETVTARRTWVVSERRVLDSAAPALFTSEQPELTLTTCWPVRYFGPAPDRLLVIARPVS